MEAYLILKVVWWLLLGVLLMGVAVMVGMDMGVGTILRYVGRTDAERRVALNIIGPHWDGNQVWFILGGGAIFAAWPLVYATAFSGLYVVMLVLLWSMILRPLGFEYRSKLAFRALAQHVGLGAVRGRLRADAGLRGSDRQHPARRAVSIQLESDLDLHGQFHRAVQSLRDPVRTPVGGDVGIHGCRDHHERRRGSDAQARPVACRMERTGGAGFVHRRRDLGKRHVRLSARKLA